MRLSEIANEVITLARAVEQARMAGTPRHERPMEGWTGDLAMAKDLNAEERRLIEFLQAQSATVVYMLLAIVYFGRGDFETRAELLDCCEDVSETFGGAKWAIRHMLWTESLADYLQNGLNRLGDLQINPDTLLTKEELRSSQHV